MLSLEHQTVYDIIKSVAVDNDVYKVIEADEILSRLPAGLKMSKVSLSQIIRDLKDSDYLDVKYFTPDEYCLLVRKLIEDPIKQVVQQDVESPRGERTLYGEREKKEPKEKVAGLGRVFFLSFLGAFFGSGIVAMIALLIIKFV